MKGKSKICTECDGVIPMGIAQCPYCGTSCAKVQFAPPREELGQSLASLYRPPYSAPASGAIGPDALEPFIEFRDDPVEKHSLEDQVKKNNHLNRISPFLPFVLLVIASQWLLFTLFYLLFGYEGKLVLVWDVFSLKVFSFFGFIALVIGIKLFRRLEDIPGS